MLQKRYILLAVIALCCCLLQACQSDPADKKASGSTTTNASDNPHHAGPVEWIGIEQLEDKMKSEPRKVMVDLYTDWCGWCKRMDKSTFSNEELAKYMNEKFYAVKFNAETEQPVTFNGKTYNSKPGGRRPTSELAYKLILGDQPSGRMGYPSFAFLDEQLNRIDAYPGYKDAAAFDVLCRYIGEGHYKNTSLPQFQQSFKSSIPPAAPNNPMQRPAAPQPQGVTIKKQS